MDTLVVPSRLFGPIEVPADACLTFPNGMLGFGGERRFVLLPAADEGLFWLQSMDQGNLAFLLVDPFSVLDGYEVDLPDVEESARERTMVLSIVTLPGPDEPCTTNLQGPLVFDLDARTGRQVVLHASSWSTKHPFDLAARVKPA